MHVHATLVLLAVVTSAASWAALLPVLVPAAAGVVVSYATEVVTKSHLAGGWKALVNVVLAAAAAAVTTATYPIASGSWRTDLAAYGAALLLAWVTSLTTHATGWTNGLQRVTASVGIGPASAGEIEHVVKARQSTFTEVATSDYAGDPPEDTTAADNDESA